MKWLALALLAFAPAAHADAEAWKGFYGGLGAGGGNSHSTWVTDATLGTLDEQVSHKARGAFLGGQFGHRWGAGPLRLGLELAWYGGKMEERSDANITGADNRERVTKILNPALLTAQLGMAASRVLVYARGGMGYANIELQAINHQVGNVATWETHALGWTAGTGFEVAVRKHLSLGLEYDYMRLTAQDRSTVNSGGVTVHADDFKTRVNLLLLRLNYLY